MSELRGGPGRERLALAQRRCAGSVLSTQERNGAAAGCPPQSGAQSTLQTKVARASGPVPLPGPRLSLVPFRVLTPSQGSAPVEQLYWRPSSRQSVRRGLGGRAGLESATGPLGEAGATERMDHGVRPQRVSLGVERSGCWAAESGVDKGVRAASICSGIELRRGETCTPAGGRRGLRDARTRYNAAACAPALVSHWSPPLSVSIFSASRPLWLRPLPHADK